MGRRLDARGAEQHHSEDKATTRKIAVLALKKSLDVQSREEGGFGNETSVMDWPNLRVGGDLTANCHTQNLARPWTWRVRVINKSANEVKIAWKGKTAA